MNPETIASKIKAGVGKTSNYQAARTLGISQQFLSDIKRGRRRLSANVAVRLPLIGVDGRALYLGQAEHDLCVADETLKAKASANER